MATNDSVAKTLIVAVTLCVVCSVLVSTAAVALKDRQEANKALDMQKKILQAAGLFDPDEDVEGGVDFDALFSKIETVVVGLATGDRVSDSAASALTPALQREAARDRARSVEIPLERDFASIKRREKLSLAYLLRENGELAKVILPVYGKGLWGTMYGLLALKGDLDTISALVFYEHVETPGLGGEVENPRWMAQWDGKRVRGDGDEIRIRVIKGSVDEVRPDAIHQVDGLSGATITSRGVTGLLRFWLGEDGFGPFLRKLKGA
jgi:Na+-transporting NADH:ubiquinone oxidoreductase subunit C